LDLSISQKFGLSDLVSNEHLLYSGDSNQTMSWFLSWTAVGSAFNLLGTICLLQSQSLGKPGLLVCRGDVLFVYTLHKSWNSVFPQFSTWLLSICVFLISPPEPCTKHKTIKLFIIPKRGLQIWESSLRVHVKQKFWSYIDTLFNVWTVVWRRFTAEVFTSQVQVGHVGLQYIVGVAEHQKHDEDYYFLMTFCH